MMKPNMAFSQSDVTRFYDSLVFPSQTSCEYSRLAAEVIVNDWRVGDFGCGQSVFYSAFRKHRVRPIFLDISFKALKTIDYGSRIQADINRAPLKDGTLNAIFCIGVLHHLPDMKSALMELTRIITSDGVLVIGVYSPKSFGARLRRAYDTIKVGLLKKVIFHAATLLLWVKLRTRVSLSLRDARKRIMDSLETPIVRYLPAAYYQEIGEKAGLKAVRQERISNMTIFYFRKLSPLQRDRELIAAPTETA